MTHTKTPRRAPLYSPADRDNLRWLWRSYLRKHAVWLGVALAMILIQGLVYQQFLQITETGLRVIFEAGAVRELALICLVVFFLFVVRGLVSYLVPLVTVRIANRAVYEMRRDLIGHLLGLDLAYFDRTTSAEILQKLVTQTQTLGTFFGVAVAGAVRDVVTVVIVSGYLIWKNPVLFAAAVLVLPFIIAVMNRVSDRVKQTQEQAEQALGDYMAGVEETVTGMRTVKIAGQEQVEADRLQSGTARLRDLMTRVQNVQALALPSIDLSSAFVYVLVIGGGGYMVLSPQFDVDGAAIITFLLGMVMVFDPARLLAQFFGALQSNLVLLRQVRGLYDAAPRIRDHPKAMTEFDASADITFDAVRFAYGDDAPLFEGLSMVLQGGKVSAIVGPTGSGKTTILSLLSRLYEVTGGQIRIGTHPIDRIRIAELRGAFSVVAQDIVIFNNSIWENIRQARPSASDADIWQAAENAEIAELIRTRGDASVGPKGAQLSGGQRQRIAIARAFLRDAPILVLDEATSALDQATEARIRAALDRLMEGRTTIIVAHRLSSVVRADCIFVLEQGRVVETGSHPDLLTRNGLYAQLFDAQKSGFDT